MQPEGQQAHTRFHQSICRQRDASVQQVWHAGLPSVAGKALRKTARIPKLLVQCQGDNSDTKKFQSVIAQAPKVLLDTDLQPTMTLYAQVERGS